MRFAASTLLRPGQGGQAASGAAREQQRLAERALADGRPGAAIGLVHAALAQLRQEGATQAAIIDALDGFFLLFQRQHKAGPHEPLPERGALSALLRRLRSYEELATWVDLQLQPLLDAQRGTTTPRQLVRALVARVHGSYADDVSLQAFAAEHGVSLAYFSRLFKDEVGMTFSDYLTHIRMERAKELLARGDLRPGEISALVGYEDPKYFGQIFKRVAGMSPIDYQRSRQG
jgi:two-component system response regulator YesN